MSKHFVITTFSEILEVDSYNDGHLLITLTDDEVGETLDIRIERSEITALRDYLTRWLDE